MAEDFEADRQRARELFEDEIDGFYAGVVRGDELDYVFAHRFDDPRTVGLQALSLLARHVEAIAEQADVPPGQVAADAARLVEQIEASEAGGGSRPDVDPGVEDDDGDDTSEGIEADDEHDASDGGGIGGERDAGDGGDADDDRRASEE